MSELRKAGLEDYDTLFCPRCHEELAAVEQWWDVGDSPCPACGVMLDFVYDSGWGEGFDSSCLEVNEWAERERERKRIAEELK